MERVGVVPNRNKDRVSEMQTSAGTFASVGWGGEEKLTLKTFYCLRKIKTEWMNARREPMFLCPGIFKHHGKKFHILFDGKERWEFSFLGKIRVTFSVFPSYSIDSTSFILSSALWGGVPIVLTWEMRADTWRSGVICPQKHSDDCRVWTRDNWPKFVPLILSRTYTSGFWSVRIMDSPCSIRIAWELIRNAKSQPWLGSSVG